MTDAKCIQPGVFRKKREYLQAMEVTRTYPPLEEELLKPTADANVVIKTVGDDSILVQGFGKVNLTFHSGGKAVALALDEVLVVHGM